MKSELVELAVQSLIQILVFKKTHRVCLIDGILILHAVSLGDHYEFHSELIWLESHI